MQGVACVLKTPKTGFNGLRPDTPLLFPLLSCRPRESWTVTSFRFQEPRHLAWMPNVENTPAARQAFFWRGSGVLDQVGPPFTLLLTNMAIKSDGG